MANTEAYAQALPQDITFPTASIDHVITVKRWCGPSSKIGEVAIETIKSKLNANRLATEAQIHAWSLYKKHGFLQTFEELWKMTSCIFICSWRCKPGKQQNPKSAHISERLG